MPSVNVPCTGFVAALVVGVAAGDGVAGAEGCYYAAIHEHLIAASLP